MVLYRALDTLTPTVRQVPQHFVAGLPAWQQIASALNPVQTAVVTTDQAAQAGASAGQLGWHYKCLIEWAYEVVRLKEAMSAPSRLRSLFTFGDLEDAVTFAKAYQKIAVFRGEPDSSAYHGHYDFSLYYTRAGQFTSNVATYSAAWNTACTLASRYWAGEIADGPVETLLYGSMDIDLAPAWINEEIC